MVRGGGGSEAGGELDDTGDMDGMNGMFDGLDDADPRSVARWARRMQDKMGGEMDLGPEFEQALTRIEFGRGPGQGNGGYGSGRTRRHGGWRRGRNGRFWRQ